MSKIITYGKESTTEPKKKIAMSIGLAIAAELVILTDGLAAWMAGCFTDDVTIRMVLTFPLVYVFWTSGILGIRAFYKRKPAIHFLYRAIPGLKQMLPGLLLLVLVTVLTDISSGGLRIYNEFVNSLRLLGIGLGLAYFTAQYIYYVLEVVLITMLIAFAQEAGEGLFKPRLIPYGGIALAVLWGLVHIVWHGSADGLLSAFNALLYGTAFLVMRKNVKYSFLLILLMFVL